MPARSARRGRRVAGHRRHEKAVHGALGGLQQIGRLRGIEAAASSRDRQLVMEWQAETQEPFDGLAERQPERRRDAAVLGSADRRLGEVPGCRFGFWRIQVLEQPGCEELPPLAEQQPLIVREGKDPGQFRGRVATRSAVRPGDPGRGQTGAAERRPTGAVGG